MPLPAELDFLFRTAFDHAPLGMVIADAEGKFLRVNQAFARLVGRSVEELVGADSSAFTHPEDLLLTRNTLHGAPSSNETPMVVEKRYVRKDGTVVWARTSISSTIAADGRTRYVIGTAEDVTEQKRTREELVETRRKLRSALIAGEVATYEWDVRRDRLWGDANFDQIFGTERDDDGTAPLGRFVDAIHPADRERVMAAVNHTVDTGAEYDIEYRVLNGTLERWVSARGRIDRSSDEGTVRFHGVVLDITARKRAEEELQRKSALYDAFLSNTEDLAYLIDREGRFIFANRALLELWGMTLEEVSGKTLYELGYPKWHADMNMLEFAQVFEKKQTIHGSVPYTSPTGVQGTYEYVFSPVLGATGEVELIAGTSRDVTERLRAAELQRRLSEQLRLALEAARMGWWRFDPAARRVYLDERTRAIFEVEAVELAYDEAVARMLPEDSENLRRSLAAALDPVNPRPYEVEYRLRSRDGSLRWVVSKGVPTFEGEGADRRAVTMVGTALDITEAKLAQEALHDVLESERAARSEAERASRMKDEFLATLSHELRTPLAAVLGWTQILGSGSPSRDEVEEGIGIIARNARAQAQIIEDLLEMSRIVSGKIRLDVQQVSLIEVVRAAVATVQAAADAKGVAIRVSSNTESVAIAGDVNRLQQVFWNLLSNAVKFTPPGGLVDIAVNATRSQVEISVRDTGEGIRPEFLPFVFDRFRQADATTTRRHGGLGLGLAIVKQLTELHGGSVRVASEGEGKGSEFAVLLPLAGVQPDDEPVEQGGLVRVPRQLPVLRPEVEGMRVLVVDDESDTRGVVRRFLEERGMIVTVASSAEEARGKLSEGTFDVLVSDIGMPREDGYSLIRDVRASGNLIPAIALTAYARPEDRERAVTAGYHSHLAKPADPEELVSLVASIVKQGTAGQPGS